MLRRRRRPWSGPDLLVVPGTSLGPVHLGMAEAEVRDVLGPPDTGRASRRWWRYLSVELDGDGRAEFVELSHDAELGWRAVYAGRDLLTAPAEEVPALLQREGPRYEEDGHTLTCATGLALWRPFLPEEDDEDGDRDEDDHHTGRCWSTVAVAAPHYWTPG